MGAGAGEDLCMTPHDRNSSERCIFFHLSVMHEKRHSRAAIARRPCVYQGLSSMGRSGFEPLKA